MTDLSESMWNLALKPLKTLFLHAHIVYDQKSWMGGGFPLGAPTNKITPFERVVLRDAN